MIYIREAHPTDGWQMESNIAEHVEYAQPQSIAERQEVANACVIGLKLSVPTLIDAMDNAADRAFNGWPERLYVLSPEGRVVYQGGKGPYGYNVEELAAFLHALTGAGPSPMGQADEQLKRG